MPQETRDNTDAVTELAELVKTGDGEAVATFLRLLPPEDTVYTVSHMDEGDRTAMFSLLSSTAPELGADLLEHFVDEYAAGVIEQMEPGHAAALVDEMDSDEQADILAVLSSEDLEAILRQMDPAEAEDARERLVYDEDVAGGLMITEYLVYNEGQTVAEVTADLHANAEVYGEYEVRYVYVVDANERLTGVVPMRSLVLVPASRKIQSQQVRNPVTVAVDTPLDDLHDLFDRVDFSAVPVIEQDGTLVGVVQRAAVQEAIGERETDQFLKFGGIVGGEELRSMTVGSRAARRLAFLLPIMGLMLLSASIIALFEHTVEQLPILAAFLPVVGGLCGSGGNQAVAVSIRELSLGLIGPGDFFRVMMKEASVAVLIGLGLGLVLGLVVLGWRHNLYLSLVLGASVPAVIVVALTLGGTVPVMLKKAGVDPAMASGPVVTTLVDLVSYCIVLGLATAMMAKLL